MILRPASISDVDALVAMSRRSFTDAFGHLYAPSDLAAFLDDWRSPRRMAEIVERSDAALTLAEDGGELLGYCAMFFGAGFDERPEPRPARPALLSQLYCTSAATGRGVGTALMDDALAQAHARGCDAVQLSVYAENFGAQRFYARYGFAKVADIDFWVGTHRDDEFLYELAL
ncbi:GNAT family N-acetyltransferase [Tsuneonella sp. YG55]|uniref:GNAT family N-acetyltransferase n=1 Tax=Tsuneonella litorea TaxID=2976475 RepID=A0A9X2W1Y6_9SPHN|nr:GNAT family N-acetyltransferase [Tsuneonella litorea]MCT2559267.1 GNAT family N-acetyltransferase [Tsuneonella litorea]